MRTGPEISETDFQAQILELAGLLGWHTAHFRPAMTKHGWRTPVSGEGKGFPDTVLVRDRVIFCELKRQSGKLREEQEWWRDWLIAAGQEWYSWKPSDFDEAAQILQRKPDPLDSAYWRKEGHR